MDSVTLVAEVLPLSHPAGIHGDMKAPTLFDPDHPSQGTNPPASLSGDRERAQLRIRQLNDERRARQDDEMRTRRRRSALVRLQRRRFHADEVEAAYWQRRRASMQLVP